MNWSYAQVFASLISYTLVIYPAGYLFVTIGRTKSFVEDLNVKLVAGLIVWVLFSLGLASLGKLRDWLLYLIILEWFFLFLYLTFKVHFRSKVKISLANYLRSKKSEFTFYSLSVFLFVVSLGYFGYIAWQMQWAPPGDAVLHSTITAIISESGKLCTPDIQVNKVGFILHEFTFGYPPAFHLLSTVMVLTTNVFPGQATLLLSAFVSSLLPMIIFSLLMHQTSSLKLSILGWASTFILPYQQFSTWPQHDLLTANLLNGTYMSHLGNLFLLFLVFVLVKEELIFRFYWGVVVCLVLTYPGYFTYVVLWSLSILIASICARSKVSARNVFLLDKRRIIFWFPALPIAIVPVIFSKEFTYALGTMQKYNANYRIYGDWLPPFLSFPYFVVIVLMIFAALSLLLSRIKLKLPTIFLSSTLVIIGALNETLYTNIFFTTYPQRFFPTFVAIGFCVLITFVSSLKKLKISQLKMLSQQLSESALVKRIICIVLLFSFTVYIFLPYLTYVPSSWGRPTGSDFEVLKWISINVPDDQLILNDPTFTGLFLSSFRTKHVVNIFPMPFSALPRANELNKLFYDPRDYGLAAKLFSKYDVRYVYVSSESVYKDWFSENWIYKQWAPQTYLTFFDNNPHLIKIFQKGYSAIYRVSPNSSLLRSLQIYVAFEDCTKWSNGTASVKYENNTIFLRVNKMNEYAGFSFILTPPPNATSAAIQLKASGKGLNKSPSIHGYVFYEDGTSNYFHSNLDIGTYDWTWYEADVVFNSFRKVETIDVRVGLLWSGYIGELKISNLTVTWR